MTKILRVVSAEAVVPGVLKIVWDDGYAGVVDLRGIMTNGPIFNAIRDPAAFENVKVEKYGHSVFWGEVDNEDVDFGADRLRELAEDQAELLRKAG